MQMKSSRLVAVAVSLSPQRRPLHGGPGNGQRPGSPGAGRRRGAVFAADGG